MNFDALTSAFSTLTAEIANAQKEILADANEHRKTFLAALAGMREAEANATKFARMIDGVLEPLADISYECQTLGDRIIDAINEPDMCPQNNFEDFIGFCAECGKEISTNDDYEDTFVGFLCDQCIAEMEAKEADEDETEDADTDTDTDPVEA